jgi:hypothetical protein
VFFFHCAKNLNKPSDTKNITRNFITMNKIIFVFLIAVITSAFNKLNAQLINLPKTGITENEAGLGIKEALGNGVTRAVGFLNKKDGFFGNELYKILLPPEILKAEKKLRAMGLGKLFDDAVLQINRGAEEAVGSAAPIFGNAIKQMTLQDALKIVSGPENSATNYFRSKTDTALTTAFSPVVKQSLEKTGATRHYTDLVNAYNKIPLIKKINPDLSAYVVERTLYALYDQIGKEEAEIRKNPVKRSSDLLQKVFGGGSN